MSYVGSFNPTCVDTLRLLRSKMLPDGVVKATLTQLSQEAGLSAPAMKSRLEKLESLGIVGPRTAAGQLRLLWTEDSFDFTAYAGTEVCKQAQADAKARYAATWEKRIKEDREHTERSQKAYLYDILCKKLDRASADCSTLLGHAFSLLNSLSVVEPVHAPILETATMLVAKALHDMPTSEAVITEAWHTA